MRCSISNPKKLKKLSERTGLNVTGALVRGNTGHRIDLILDGKNGHKPHKDPSLWPDGSLTVFDWETGSYKLFIKE
jgi:hypothetical protein